MLVEEVMPWAFFSAFLNDEECKLYGIEPAGKSLDNLGEHAATMTHGKPGGHSWV